MPVYLGTTPVTLKIGTQGVAGFLGDVAVTASARTLYFTGADDNDWSNLANWFDDDEGTIPAASLPTAVDSVFAAASVLSNSGSAPTVYAFEMDGIDLVMDIPFTVVTLAVFRTSAIGGISMILNGDAEWYGTNGNAGVVNGNATFNNSTFNDGTINGDATFNGSGSIGGGIVTGTTTNNR